MTSPAAGARGNAAALAAVCVLAGCLDYDELYGRVADGTTAVIDVASNNSASLDGQGGVTIQPPTGTMVGDVVVFAVRAETDTVLLARECDQFRTYGGAGFITVWCTHSVGPSDPATGYTFQFGLTATAEVAMTYRNVRSVALGEPSDHERHGSAEVGPAPVGSLLVGIVAYSGDGAGGATPSGFKRTNHAEDGSVDVFEGAVGSNYTVDFPFAGLAADGAPFLFDYVTLTP